MTALFSFPPSFLTSLKNFITESQKLEQFFGLFSPCSRLLYSLTPSLYFVSSLISSFFFTIVIHVISLPLSLSPSSRCQLWAATHLPSYLMTLTLICVQPMIKCSPPSPTLKWPPPTNSTAISTDPTYSSSVQLVRNLTDHIPFPRTCPVAGNFTWCIISRFSLYGTVFVYTILNK